MAILERLLVTAEPSMSDRDFARHMNKRHSESLGYLGPFRKVLDPPMMRIWRIYHNTLHRLRIDIEHEHGEAW